MKNALIKELPTDYRLRDEFVSCWITVGKVSVHIVRENEGARVEIMSLDDEDGIPLAECEAQPTGE